MASLKLKLSKPTEKESPVDQVLKHESQSRHYVEMNIWTSSSTKNEILHEMLEDFTRACMPQTCQKVFDWRPLEGMRHSFRSAAERLTRLG